MESPFLLGEMTWEEAGEAIRESDFIVQPTGSFEQHGPHLPLLTDSIRAEHLSRMAVEEAWKQGLKIYLLPPLYYGISEHHMRFPGTITLSPETYLKVLEDIGGSLARHGARRLVYMNFHGGNLPILQAAAGTIRAKHGLRVYIVHWTTYARKYIEEHLKPSKTWGHACEHETSMIMLFRPELVRMDRIRRPNVKARAKAPTFVYFDEITDTGGLGDPARSSREAAEIIVSKTTEDIVKLFREILEAEENLYKGGKG